MNFTLKFPKTNPLLKENNRTQEDSVERMREEEIKIRVNFKI